MWSAASRDKSDELVNAAAFSDNAGNCQPARVHMVLLCLVPGADSAYVVECDKMLQQLALRVKDELMTVLLVKHHVLSAFGQKTTGVHVVLSNDMNELHNFD